MLRFGADFSSHYFGSLFMKTLCVLSTLTLLVATSDAAEPQDEVIQAAKMLGDKENYSWTSTVNNLVPSSRFRIGPTQGQIEKGGFTKISMSFGDNSFDAVLKGDKGAVKTSDGWQSLTEAGESGNQNAGRFLTRYFQSLQSPAEQAADLAGKTYGISKSGEVYGGDLNQEAVKQLLTFGRRPGAGTDAPEPMLRDGAGAVKFWIQEGKLVKYEYSVKGFVTFGGSERQVDRITTVEIKNVGTTRVDVPQEALQKAS
jgi:hypothetical protein